MRVTGPRLQPTAPPRHTSSKGHTLRIYNRSRQTISLQLCRPGGDFFLTEQQVHLGSGKSVELPKDHVRMEQINNLSVRGILRVTHDSEAVANG